MGHPDEFSLAVNRNHAGGDRWPRPFFAGLRTGPKRVTWFKEAGDFVRLLFLKGHRLAGGLFMTEME
ncbi:MAG: hypothetical protein AAF514_23655, partial [Verrucomicrobiota bacterium]